MLKAIGNIKSIIGNTLITLTIGVILGIGATGWLMQKNLDQVCGLVSARNQFIDFVKQDSK